MDSVDAEINELQREIASLERRPEENRSGLTKSRLNQLKEQVVQLTESKPEPVQNENYDNSPPDVSTATGMLNEFDSVMEIYIQEDEPTAAELYDFVGSLQDNEKKLKAQREIIEIRRKGEYPYLAEEEILSSPNRS